jgi:hypothetical protein
VVKTAFNCIVPARERIFAATLSVDSITDFANPTAGFAKDAGSGSPSPEGAGRGGHEDGRLTNFIGSFFIINFDCKLDFENIP